MSLSELRQRNVFVFTFILLECFLSTLSFTHFYIFLRIIYIISLLYLILLMNLLRLYPDSAFSLSLSSAIPGPYPQPSFVPILSLLLSLSSAFLLSLSSAFPCSYPQPSFIPPFLPLLGQSSSLFPTLKIFHTFFITFSPPSTSSRSLPFPGPHIITSAAPCHSSMLIPFFNSISSSH